MAKKMHDILPPGSMAAKKETSAKEVKVAVKKRKKIPASVASVAMPEVKKTVTNLPSNPKKRFPLRELLVGGGVIVLLLCVWGYIKLPKADVQIWPKTDTLILSLKLSANTSAKAIDTTGNIIPARYIEAQKDITQDFPATGVANNDGLATGTIKIYNKISPSSPFTLITGTHFLSDSGKYFVTTQKVVVPAARNNVPGSVTVTVQAQGAGEDYNIPASKFSIPKLNGTAYYYSLSGASTTPMSGGHTGSVKKVTDDDISGAKDVLTKQLLDNAQTSLKSSLGPDEILLDGAISQNNVTASASVKSGATVSTFTETASVKVSALVFKKQDLVSFIQTNAKSKLTANTDFLGNTLQITYNSESANTQKGQLALDLKASLQTYYVVAKDAIVNALPGEGADAVKQTVNQLYQDNVSELKVNFWPFWVKSVPSDKSRITIETLFK